MADGQAGAAAGGRGRQQLMVPDKDRDAAWTGGKVNRGAGSKIPGNLSEESFRILKKKLHPREFEEIVLKENLLVEDESINQANRSLVNQFNEMRDTRLTIFEAVFGMRKLTKEQFKKLLRRYNRLLNQTLLKIEEVQNLGGVPAQMARHFNDVKFKV